MLGEMVDHGFETADNSRVEPGQIVGWVEGFKAISDVYCVATGKFRAMKVVTETKGGGTAKTTISWYADGVGLVKTTTEGGQFKYGSQLTDYSFKKKPSK